jgi:head-tail adaptor
MARTPRLSCRVTLETPVRTPDGGGGVTLDWMPQGRIWAEIRASSAREGVVGERPSARVTHRISIRRGAVAAQRPTPEQRLRLGSRIFAILGVAEADPGGAYLTIWAEEGPFS